MTATNSEKKPVQIEQSFDLLWPISAVDPRVDITRCQQALIDCMQKSLYGESSMLSFVDIEEFMTYATTHACRDEGLMNVHTVAKPKGRNMTEGGYVMTYTGNFVGDGTVSDATYDFHPYIVIYGVAQPQNAPNYLHFSKETGVPFKLKDRYSLSTQSKIVSMIRGGNVVCDTPEEKETFNSVREACADVDENFYVKDNIIYFYKRPFSSCQPMHVGVRQSADVLANSAVGKRQSYSEYVFTSFDLNCFDLHDHVETMSVQGAAISNHAYRFNQKGELVEVDGCDPFSATSEDGFMHMERDKSGRLKGFADIIELSDSYQYLETDSHGNWIKRKLKQGGEGTEETRIITYY